MDTGNDAREWLETDGLGGFASGTVSGVRTRRYHALLLTAVTPPTGRFVLVNGLDAFVETEAGRFALSGQRYAGDVVSPDGPLRVESFRAEPWPCWSYRLGDDVRVEQEVFVTHDRPQVVIRWRLVGAATTARLEVKPFLSGRDYHALHHENPAFDFAPEVGDEGGRDSVAPYPGLPAVVARSNGRYAHEPQWYRSFLYAEEKGRGLDCVEDLAAPGSFHFDLAAGEAVLVLSAGAEDAKPEAAQDALALAAALRATETRRRARLADPLDRAADSYLVRRGAGQTIVAGYPWFTDWGRDTFIALRGLCFATGRYDDARAILLEWAGAVSQGMLPNRFPDRAEAPEYNSVDASLWYVVAVHELLEAADAGRARLGRRERERLTAAVGAILDGHRRGTRHGIRMDADGLLAAGEPGVQLTWMDAKIGDRVITPRIGKPVEIQALWLNALRIGARLGVAAPEEWERGRAAFLARFWSDEKGALADVVDVDHEPGRVDLAFRPNQILAIGGLPVPGPRGRPGAARGGRRRGPARDAARPALAGAGRSGLPAGLRRRHRRARRGLPPGHGLAVAPRPVRRGLGARPRRDTRGEARGAREVPSPAARSTSARPVSATCRRSRTATRRTVPAAARSRPGRSASCCGWSGWCSRTRRRAPESARPGAARASAPAWHRARNAGPRLASKP